MEQARVIRIESEVYTATRRKMPGVARYQLNNGPPLTLAESEKERLYDFLTLYELVRKELTARLTSFPQPDREAYAQLYGTIVASAFVDRDEEDLERLVGEFSVPAEPPARLFSPLFQEALASNSFPSFFSTAGSFAKEVLEREYDPGVVERYAVEVKNWMFSPGTGGDVAVGPPSLDRLVGNDEVIGNMRGILYLLQQYDSEAGVNTAVAAGIPVPRTILLTGPPGTGKSTLVQQLIEEAADRSGVAPLTLYKVSNLLKTKYQNEGIQRLNTLFQRADKTPGVHLFLVDDADTIFFSRSRKNVSEEQEQFTSLMMERLENGTLTQRGRDLYIFISNYAERLDKALLDRISEVTFRVLGPQTPEEYARAFEQKLQGWARHDLLAVEDWKLVGSVAARHGFSGRDVKNIVVSLGNAVCPWSQYVLPQNQVCEREEWENFLASRGAKITDGVLEGAIERYAEMKSAEFRRARKEALQTRVADVEIDFLARQILREQLREKFSEEELM